MGYTLFYLTLIVLLPLGALVWKSAQLSWAEFWGTITDPIVVASYKLTFGASVFAAAINGVFGLIVAWVLVRYPLPGKRIFDALIDLPFALPTAVAGLTFSTLYLREGWIGGLGNHFTDGINVLTTKLGMGALLSQTALSWLTFPYSNTTSGIVIVLVFVGLPFVVRTVQPVLQEWDVEFEQAAASLGASRFATFRRVILPEILPALLSGVALAFARAVGEYGSVIFIASGIPGRGQIAPMRIMEELAVFRYERATAIAVVLLASSLMVLLLITGVEWWSRRHERVKSA
jgi:sulfate transport system permease protein